MFTFQAIFFLRGFQEIIDILTEMSHQGRSCWIIPAHDWCLSGRGLLSLVQFAQCVISIECSFVYGFLRARLQTGG